MAGTQQCLVVPCRWTPWSVSAPYRPSTFPNDRFDPRNYTLGIGRVLMAHGCDAELTATLGPKQLESFKVWSDPVSNAALRQPSDHVRELTEQARQNALHILRTFQTELEQGASCLLEKESPLEDELPKLNLTLLWSNVYGHLEKSDTMEIGGVK